MKHAVVADIAHAVTHALPQCVSVGGRVCIKGAR